MRQEGKIISAKDDKKSIEVSKSFINKTATKEGDIVKQNYFVIDKSNLSKAESTFKFFADNSASEFSLQTFGLKNSESGKVEESFGVLSTSHSAAENEKAKNYAVAQGERKDVKLYIVRDIHNHPPIPGHPDARNYPSGFTPEGKIDPTVKDGDRNYYELLRKKYGGRIPNLFEIYHPSSGNTIKYNDKTYE